MQREDEKYRHIAKRAYELGLDLKTVKNIYRNIIAMSIQVQGQSESGKSRLEGAHKAENAE